MTPTTFEEFAALGYKRLVPIVPPSATISKTSTLHRAIDRGNDPRGKAVGIKNRAGEWFSYDWVSVDADEVDYRRWQAMEAGIGIKTGDGLVLIDADTTNKDFAKIIHQTLTETVSGFAVRIGRYPKAGYLVRTDSDFAYTKIDFGDQHPLERVEILAEGKQFVAHGIHPVTKKPYTWPAGTPKLADLPYISSSGLLAFLDRLTERLPKASRPQSSSINKVSQRSLTGSLHAVRAAVEALPNTSNAFPTRESYIKMGYAIKAALPDYPNEALAIYQDWCEKWKEKDSNNNTGNDPDVVLSDWARAKPPFKVGAQYIYDLAEQHALDWNPASVWFEPVDDEDSNADLFDLPPAASDTYRLLTLSDITTRPPPTWLIDRHIPEKSVGFIYAEPAAGKTFVALDMALSIAYGHKDWHSDRISAPENAIVIYIAGEGSFGFRNRVNAWHQSRHPGEPMDNSRFLLLEQAVNFMSNDDVHKLLRTLESVRPRGRPVLVVVDTVSRALPGADENLQKDMTIFVRACDAVKETFGCAVIGVHHAGKSGDMRGSTVLLGAGDFVFRLSRKKGHEIGAFLCEKQKDGPDGWTDHYRFNGFEIGDGQSSLVVERTAEGESVGTTLTPSVAASVLASLDKAWEDKVPWSMTPQTKERYAVRRMVADFGFEGAEAEKTLKVWLGVGTISVGKVGSKGRISGLYVVKEGDEKGGIFE